MKNTISLILLTLFLVLAFCLAFSQDDIIMLNNDVLKAKVDEVGMDMIKYRKLDNLDGPQYDLPKGNVYEVYAEKMVCAMLLMHNRTAASRITHPWQMAPAITCPLHRYLGVTLMFPLLRYRRQRPFMNNLIALHLAIYGHPAIGLTAPMDIIGCQAYG